MTRTNIQISEYLNPCICRAETPLAVFCSLSSCPICWKMVTRRAARAVPHNHRTASASRDSAATPSASIRFALIRRPFCVLSPVVATIFRLSREVSEWRVRRGARLTLCESRKMIQTGRRQLLRTPKWRNDIGASQRACFSIGAAIVLRSLRMLCPSHYAKSVIVNQCAR